MKDCIIKSEPPFNNVSPSSSLKSNTETSSSSESLITLLNASIKNQQACFKAFSQNTSQMSNINHKEIKEDEEFELLVKQMLEKSRDNTASDGEETPKKKKKKEYGSKKELKFDECEPKKHKRKHQDSNIEEDVKLEKKKHRQSDLGNNGEVKACSPYFESDYWHRKNEKMQKKYCNDVVADSTNPSVKKIKKKKDKHSSISEAESNVSFEIRVTPKKHKHTSVSENEDSLEITKKKKKKHKREVLEEEIIENDLPVEIKIKKKHKHSSVSDIEDSHEMSKKKKKHKSGVSEAEMVENDLPVEIKIKKKHKHSSFLEQEEEHKHTSVSEIEDANDTIKKKKKKKHKKSDSVLVENDSQTKHKHIDLSEELEHGQVLQEKKDKHTSVSEIKNDNEIIKKKKKKHKNNVSITENDLEESVLINNLPVQIKIKKKHKHNHSEEENEKTEIKDSNETKKKKKHKHLNVTETEGHETIEKKKKNKHFNSLDLDNDIENSSLKKKHNYSNAALETDLDDQIKSTEKSSPQENAAICEQINLENETPTKLKRKKHKNEEEKINSPEKNNTEILNHSTISQGEKTSPTKEKKKHLRFSVLEIKQENDSEGYESPLTTPKHTRLASISDSSSDQEEKIQTPNKSDVMDQINEALDTAEESRLDSTDLAFLSELCIGVPWEVPPSHRIETRLSHPTPEQYKQFKELDIAMKSGPYNKEEDQKIKDNWEEFCRLHDLDVSPSAFCPQDSANRTLLPTSERIKFVQFLGKGLENRNLCSIYSRFQILFKSYKKGKFTQEEDNIILTYIENVSTPNKYAALSKILNRRRELIKTRYVALMKKCDRIKWNMSVYQEVINNLLEVTGKNFDDLKDFKIEPAHWKALEEKMKLPAAKIRRKWQLYLSPALFADEFNNLSEIKIKLIDLLDENQVDDRKKIDWNKLAKHFDGMNNTRLSRIFADMVDYQVPPVLKTNFTATIKYLKEKLPQMPVKGRKSLIKLVYRDGQLCDSKKVVI